MEARFLNDDEVLHEMNKIEALEKAREIMVKADEEFAIEKAKLVKQAIDGQYEKKRKGVEVTLLAPAVEQQLNDYPARLQIVTFAKDETRYTHFLEGAIVQGLFWLMEPRVTLIFSGHQVATAVEGSLNDESSGGVMLVNGTKRITINDILDERLRLLEGSMLPEIRRDLFGANDNRQFYS